MTAPSRNPLGAALDARVEDYLDDKLQSFADLDALDELIANVEVQRTQLQTQLDTANKDFEEARRTAGDRYGSLQARIKEFQELQDSIDVRVQIAAASDAPSEAIARLKPPMMKLQNVDIARNYLILLQDVEKLRVEARSHLPESPKAALGPYSQLKELALKLRSLPGSEDLHLVDHVEAVSERLWSEMKGTMSAELEALLTDRNWPRVDRQSEMDDQWLACVEKLLDLQIPEIIHTDTTVPLLPIDVMSKIFTTEFRFHFLSDKPTSSLQSVGSHCFPWFLSTIEKWEGFFRDNLAHLFAAKFEDTAVADKLIYVDPVCALVTSMLAVMREKIYAVASEAIKNPSYLSSFMSQLIMFDDNVRSRFNYDGGYTENGWPGLTAEVLETHFEAWFQAERSYALERFEAILESQEGRKLDYDYAETGKMKPTFAAVQIMDLLKTVTTKYERLHRLKYRVRFLMRIQLDILDSYHDRLRGSLEAYQSMTSTLGRTLHGATKEQMAALEGTGAMETLCKVIGSADHVANTLTEWGDEEFFTVLWDELQARDSRQKRVSANGPSNEDEFDASEKEARGERGKDSAIFDETVSAYLNRRKAAETLLIGALVESHAKAFRSYTHRVQWTIIGETAEIDDASELSITPELDEPLAVMKRNFDFLIRALSGASFRRVWRETLGKLQDLLWNSVLLRQSFTTAGAAQFAHDGAALFAVIERYIMGGSGALDALREGMQLLNLPVCLSKDEGGEAAAVTTQPTLKEASDRAFKDNDEARELLEELGLESLTPLNARHILQRRVENNDNIGW